MENETYTQITIPTYIINLKERNDRREHILNEFKEKPEFDTTIIEAVKHKNGALGLWKSIVKIIKLAIKNDDDVIIIVEDDHLFTKDYNKEYLISNIISAHEKGADILLGGTSGGHKHLIPVTYNQFWIDHFWGTQFVVIYKPFFEKIINAKFKSTDAADDFISKMTSNKLVLFPFVSVQKEFGYSDVTQGNNIQGSVENYFKKSIEAIETYYKAAKKYNII